MSKSHLFKITLHLARTQDYPEGSTQHGYSFIAPLKNDGRIDADLWRSQPQACIVRRFWGDEQPKHGRLLHRPGGSNGATWVFDYDARTRADDEFGFRFADHRFAPGEYVSIRDPDDDMRTFRVAKVDPA